MSTLEDRAAARAARRSDVLRASTVRALGRDSSVCFRAGLPYRGSARMRMLAPHLHATTDEDAACRRGAADALALHLRATDVAVHQRYRPVGAVGCLVYDQLEQFRVESSPPRSLPGMTANLAHRTGHWLEKAAANGLTHTESGLLLLAVAAMSWSHLTGRAVPIGIEETIEPMRAVLAPEFGPRAGRFARLRGAQDRFAPMAAEFSLAVADLLGSASGPPRRARSAGQRALADLLHGSGPDAAGNPSVTVPGVSAGEGGYRIFTTAHDRQRTAAELVRPAQLKEFRARLDELVAQARLHHGRTRRALAASLTGPSIDGWEHGLEQGRIDGRRLSTLVASPGEHRIFQDEAIAPRAAASVTVLLDCSGSMKQHVPLTAVVVDALTRALDALEVPTEVLGFTTAAWNGGRALRDWHRAGRPAEPGRLNDRLHLVFKDADTSWRGARHGLAGLFKADLFREGLGGEALRWAATRARTLDARRTILVVVTDGAPADSATARLNRPDFLEADLVHAAHEAEAAGTEVRALSLGVDLGRFFPRCLVLPAEERAGQALVDEVVATLGRRR
ncbi:cobaltochelatase CobT-related protein [Amycolatopsis jiangsuensis]|uniref:Cobaltochelatase CobT n=1 Tax=Amycolatopsis jiangsuensis TaxID=1181879 RepID=A0A840IQE7_9PSEU|nr:cobalt chelatase [Amycolatopsis jiangsuensis]MBB4684063.1 cobaltochelatase CobT [Amycolatopsis jiangsuensis]